MRKSRVGEIQDRFWGRVERRGPDECWNWTGAVNNRGGYGVIGGTLYGKRYVPNGANMLAHRASWIMHFGTPDADEAMGWHGWVVLHRCDNPRCVNPAHLRLGTQADNVADMNAKKRGNHVGIKPKGGTQHRRAALTADQVAEIVSADCGDDVLAEKFSVHRDTIKRVRLGESYTAGSGGARRVLPRPSMPGEKNPTAKLTYEQVKFARESSLSTYAIAAALGVTQVCAAAARRGATYRDVDVPCPPPRVGRPKRV